MTKFFLMKDLLQSWSKQIWHLGSYAVINCTPGPHYPGNSGDLAGTHPWIYRILCPRRPRTYPGLMRGDLSVKRASSRNLLPRNVNICWDSDQRRPGLWGGDLPGDLQEKCPPQSRAVPGAVPWTSQSTKLNPRASPHYPKVVGGWGNNW